MTTNSFDSLSTSDSTYAVEIYTGEIYTATVFYFDTWHELPIDNATVEANSSQWFIVDVIAIESDQENAGYYYIELMGLTSGSAVITVNVSKTGYESLILSILVVVHPGWNPPPPPPIYGLPMFMVVSLLVFLYSRKKQNSEDIPSMSDSGEMAISTDGPPEEGENE